MLQGNIRATSFLDMYHTFQLSFPRKYKLTPKPYCRLYSSFNQCYMFPPRPIFLNKHCHNQRAMMLSLATVVFFLAITIKQVHAQSISDVPQCAVSII